MCGRFTQTKSRKEALEELADMELPPLFGGRYNIAPQQEVSVIRSQTPQCTSTAVWGFENIRSSAPVINARIESLHERPMFRDLLRSNRCLVPADGFYEWKNRTPYYFQLKERSIFAFAGLWRNGECVIITKEADRSMRGIHHRMPVLFRRHEWNNWLSGEDPGIAPELIKYPVSRYVNKVAHDSPRCIARGDEQIDFCLFPDEG